MKFSLYDVDTVLGNPSSGLNMFKVTSMRFRIPSQKADILSFNPNVRTIISGWKIESINSYLNYSSNLVEVLFVLL